ncbi:MAG: S-layer homology domain-containing protein [Candidatus Pristimantibacillus sp.]
MFKKWFSSITALLIMLSLILPHAQTVHGAESLVSDISEPALTDINGHWAEKVIASFVERDIVKGYQDGSFKPENPINRAEIVTVTNKLFGYTEVTTSTYKDVQSTDWFALEVGKAQQAGYISGYSDGNFKPNKSITRQELAVLISNLLSLSPSDSADQYTDTVDSPTWSKGAIGAVIDAEIMTGYKGQTFKPTSPVTRAEAVTVLDRAFHAQAITYDKAGMYGPESGVEKINKNVVINAADITLRNVEINGDLLLGQGIGEGDVTLNNVKVNGTTTVQGGGENSIHFENSIMVTVVVDKASGKVRIVVNGATYIADVSIQSNAKIEAEAGAQINSVTLAEALPKDSQVQLVGSFESVNVIATNIVVEIPKGSVKELNVSQAAGGAQINLGKEASIISLIMNAATSVLGQGKIQNATVNSEGITMEKAPDQTKLGSNVPADTTITIDGKETSAGQGNNSSNSGNSGGSSGGGGVTDPGTGTTDPEPGEGGGIDPLPSGPVPVLSEVTFETTVGESVYAISNLDGSIYIVKNGTTRNSIALEEAVNVGEAVKVAVSANEGVYIDTAGLDTTKVNFLVIAVSKEQQLSYPTYIRLFAGASDPLDYSGTSYTADTNNIIYLGFNKYINNNLTDLAELKSAITFAADGVNFQPLNDGDDISIYQNEIKIKFAVPYSGKNNTIKLAPNSIIDNDGNVYDKELISYKISAGLMVTKMSYASTFKAGVDPITVRVNEPVTVYLVRANLGLNTLYDIENEVVAGRGKKLAIGAADQDADIPTDGLAPGSYVVSIWAGNSFHVTIE